MRVYKSYSEKLRDPRWQKRRLQIMDLAEFQCEECGSSTKTMAVHHKIYRKGAQPWDYADEELACLCEDCHEVETNMRSRLDEALAKLDRSNFEKVIGFAEGTMLMIQHHDNPGTTVSVPSMDYATGISASVCADIRETVDLVEGQCGMMPGSQCRLTARGLLSFVCDILRSRRIASGLPESGF